VGLLDARLRSPREDLPLSTTLGCDLGGSAIKLARLRGTRIEKTIEIPTPTSEKARAIVGAIAAAMQSLSGGRSLRACIAVPGFLDAGRRRVVRLSNLPALDGVLLAREVERRVPGLSITLDADTNAAAVAEARLGAGRGVERVLYVTLGTGLGAALAVNGFPVRVSRHTVGQVAHVPVASAGPRCYCGARGCAESLLAARGILWRARRNGIRSVRSTEQLFRLAREPKRAARAAARGVWRETGELLGGLLRVIAPLFSPDRIVVGGGVAGAAQLFLPAARDHLARRLSPRTGVRATVRAAQLGRIAGAAGAALLAREGASCHPS
jgi:glucokinase